MNVYVYQGISDYVFKMFIHINNQFIQYRAANISTTLPEPDLNNSTSPQLTQLLMGSNQTQTTMHNMQPQTSCSVPGTLHHLLKTHHSGGGGGPNSSNCSSSTPAISMSRSVDSPRRMEMGHAVEEDDCVIMEGDWLSRSLALLLLLLLHLSRPHRPFFNCS